MKPIKLTCTANRLIHRLACIITISAFTYLQATPAISDEDVFGNYQGSPYETWQSLYAKGLQVRTFQQPKLSTQQTQDNVVVRRYLQYVPQKVYQRKQLYPLVIALHGANINAEYFRMLDLDDRLERMADQEQFILAYANAYALDDSQTNTNIYTQNNGYWRTCVGTAAPTPDFTSINDIDYLRRVIAKMQAENLPIDPDRIYVLGMSNGGEMALHAAREMPDVVAAVGAVMPVMSMPATQAFGLCHTPEPNQDPVSIMMIYTPNDPVLKPIFASINLSYGEMIQSSIDAWLGALGIDSATEQRSMILDRAIEFPNYTGEHPTAIATSSSQAERIQFAKAQSGAKFEVIEVGPTAGHAWPNFTKSVISDGENQFGFRNQDFEAEQEIWQFLKGKTKLHTN